MENREKLAEKYTLKEAVTMINNDGKLKLYIIIYRYRVIEQPLVTIAPFL